MYPSCMVKEFLVFTAPLLLFTPTAPDRVMNLTYIGISPLSITIQWVSLRTVERNGRLTGYRIMIRQNMAIDDTRVDTNVTSGSLLNFTITGLMPGEMYTIRVAALNPTEGFYSSPLLVTTPQHRKSTSLSCCCLLS